MMLKCYPIYKGLQKPLIYKGFKGKYIYWGLASILSGLIAGSIIAIISNIIFAAPLAITTMSAGLGFTIMKQKKGLYNKNKHMGKFFIQTHLSIQYVKK